MNTSIQNPEPNGIVQPSPESSKSKGPLSVWQRESGRFTFAAVLAGLFFLLFSAPAVRAHESPLGCTGSGLGILLFTDTSNVHIGDTICYSATVFNGLNAGIIVCDATAIQAFIVTPDGVSHPIALVRTSLVSGQSDYYPNVVSYVVRAQDIHPDGTLLATAQAVPRDPKGRLAPDTDESKQFVSNIVAVSDEFLRKLQSDPKLLHELSPRFFEEVVAEILKKLNYEVTLTRYSKDGGKDIIAKKKDHLGTFLFFVECKRYAPNKPIGVGLVRQLNGVVQAGQATAGILVTTSFFTRGAKEFQKKIEYQMSLKDPSAIQAWLDEIARYSM
jgi:hypothetical protein